LNLFFRNFLNRLRLLVGPETFVLQSALDFPTSPGPLFPSARPVPNLPSNPASFFLVVDRLPRAFFYFPFTSYVAQRSPTRFFLGPPPAPSLFVVSKLWQLLKINGPCANQKEPRWEPRLICSTLSIRSLSFPDAVRLGSLSLVLTHINPGPFPEFSTTRAFCPWNPSRILFFSSDIDTNYRNPEIFPSQFLRSGHPCIYQERIATLINEWSETTTHKGFTTVKTLSTFFSRFPLNFFS